MLIEEFGLTLEHLGSVISLFVDDRLIFIKACDQSAQRLNDIIRIYAEAYVQSVSKEKSVVYFSPNSPRDVCQIVKQMQEISFEAFTEHYLHLSESILSKGNRTSTLITKTIFRDRHASICAWKTTSQSQGV